MRPNPRLQRTRSASAPSPLSRQPLGDSRKVSQASSQDSDSNALQSETGGPGSISRLS